MATDRETFLGLVDEQGRRSWPSCGGCAAGGTTPRTCSRTWLSACVAQPGLPANAPKSARMAHDDRVSGLPRSSGANTKTRPAVRRRRAAPRGEGGIKTPAVLTDAASGGIVADAVAELSQATRSVVTLHYTGGLSLREVAKTLGISVGTVKSRLNSALEQLRRRLS